MLTKEQMMLKKSRKIPINIMGSIPEFMATISSTLLSLFLGWEMIRRYCPKQIITAVENFFKKVNLFFNPYIQVSIHEFLGNNLKPHEAYATVEAYLSINSSKTAKRLKAEKLKDSNKMVLSMDDYEKVTDEFQGVEVKWVSGRIHSWRRSMPMSFSGTPELEKKYFKIVFHKQHRELIFGTYLEHVIKTGTEIMQRNRQRKLYTNCHNRSTWSYIVFDHPATFDTLAMEPQKKQEIVEDLLTFSKSKDFYARIGKAWKRGYLLYGPPGTGKSTMIAAMANLLDYDVYDLELTSVRDNTELRKLLSETSGKSIIVMEDIDCSLDLTGPRRKEQEKSQQNVAEKRRKEVSRKEESGSKVTLSGLLNFIDGLWSACGGERIIVFTTNYVDKLDSALTRRGRMDKHIELSYCSFEAFKVLAKNYLLLESHPLFESISQLMEVTKITPADVAENLMSKSLKEDAEKCLMNLIQSLQEAKTKQDQALDNEKAKQAMKEHDDEAKEHQILKESQKSKEALGEAKTKEAMKECDQALEDVETQHQRLKEFQKSKEALEEAKQAMKELLELVLKEKIEMQKEPQESKEVLGEAKTKEAMKEHNQALEEAKTTEHERISRVINGNQIEEENK